ncbi:unnamed protein product, partial [Prorocentrum cordatum]
LAARGNALPACCASAKRPTEGGRAPGPAGQPASCRPRPPKLGGSKLLRTPSAAAARAPWRRAAGLEGLSSAHEAARELGEPPRRAARRSPLEAGGGGGPRRGPSELGRAGRGGQAGAR